MDKQIDARFDRVDKALANLIDSIAKFNPVQGSDLVVADTELSQGLEELQAHQQNHIRIQHLRSITSNLDVQIKDTLTTLAQTRKELVSTPATIFPSDTSYPIKYPELLTYARRISKTTLPSAAVAERMLAVLQPNPVSAEETAAPPVETAQTNGVASTPTAATPANGTQTLDPISQQSAVTSLPEHIASDLNPLADAEFIPWPSEEHLRKGALASLAFLAEMGIEAENFDPVEEEARKQREEEEARAREERERLETEERERKIWEQREAARKEAEKQREKEQAEGWRRASVIGGPAGAGPSAGAGAASGEKKQFQFMGDDDESD